MQQFSCEARPLCLIITLFCIVCVVLLWMCDRRGVHGMFVPLGRCPARPNVGANARTKRTELVNTTFAAFARIAGLSSPQAAEKKTTSARASCSTCVSPIRLAGDDGVRLGRRGATRGALAVTHVALAIASVSIWTLSDQFVV